MVPIPELSHRGVEYVPMFWGRKYLHNWEHKIAPRFKHNHPKYVVAHNEPDVPSQAHTSGKQAAEDFQKYLAPLRHKYGTKLGSPQIVYNIHWMDSFMRALKKRGGHVDFVALHTYQSWKNVGQLKRFISTVHKRYGKNIWVTEFGTTTASHPSQRQAKKFMTEATKWMESTGYVDRAAWFGAFANPPDGYASKNNALFTHRGGLTSLGHWWSGSDGSMGRRDGAEPLEGLGRRRHHKHLAAKRVAAEDDDAEDEEDDELEHPDADHCDERCRALDELMDKFDNEPFDEDADDDEDA